MFSSHVCFRIPERRYVQERIKIQLFTSCYKHIFYLLMRLRHFILYFSLFLLTTDFACIGGPQGPPKGFFDWMSGNTGAKNINLILWLILTLQFIYFDHGFLTFLVVFRAGAWGVCAATQVEFAGFVCFLSIFFVSFVLLFTFHFFFIRYCGNLRLN